MEKKIENFKEEVLTVPNFGVNYKHQKFFEIYVPSVWEIEEGREILEYESIDKFKEFLEISKKEKQKICNYYDKMIRQVEKIIEEKENEKK